MKGFSKQRKTIEHYASKHLTVVKKHKKQLTESNAPIKRYNYEFEKDSESILKQTIFNEIISGVKIELQNYTKIILMIQYIITKVPQLVKIFKNMILHFLFKKWKEMLKWYWKAQKLVSMNESQNLKEERGKKEKMESLEIDWGSKKKKKQKQKIFFWCMFFFAGYFSWHLRQKTPYKQANAVSKFFADYSSMVSEAKYEVTNGKGLKILTFKQMLQRLLIALAQIKAGNTSESLLKEIRQNVYSLYQAN